MIRILFVCTGNICRSPTADGVLRHELRALGIDADQSVDSAGTYAGHQGDAPDPRTIAAAARRGYDLSSLQARVIRPTDFQEFDLILGMDRGHVAAINQMRTQMYPQMRSVASRAQTGLFLDLLPGYEGQDVPDPYYGDAADFEHVLDLVVPVAKILLKRFSNHHV